MEVIPLIVCENCFTDMKAISKSDTTIERDRIEYCSKCRRPWKPATVALDPDSHDYVRIRMKTQHSILKACGNYKSCKLSSCPYAHNRLELEIWEGIATHENSMLQSHNPDTHYLSQIPVTTDLNSTIQQNIHIAPGYYKYPIHRPPQQLQSNTRMPYNMQNMPSRGRGVSLYNPNASVPGENDIDLYFENVLKFSNSNESSPNSIIINPINQPLQIQIELDKSPKIFEWTFLVTTLSEDVEMLLGVILTTDFDRKFRLYQAKYQDRQTGGFELVDTPPERRGTVLKLKKAINKHCSVRIPVQFKVELGEYNARIIFDFSRLQIVKRLAVLVHRECHDIQAPQDVQAKFKSFIPSKQRESLLWDKDYQVKYIDSPYLDRDFNNEVFTSKIPVNLDEMIKNEKHLNVLKEELTYKNYKRIFEMLLYLEEYECRRIFLDYDLKDQPINRKIVCNQFDKYDKGRGGTEFAGKGYSFLKLEMCGSLFEGFHFLRPPNIALIKPKALHNFVYYCPSVELGHDYIWIVVSDEMVAVCEQYGGVADVRFKESSIDFHFSTMHQALQLIDPRTVFPSVRNKTAPSQLHPDYSSYWRKSDLSATQRHAITSALDSSFQNIPTVISGPFGCGKSWTLANLAYILGSQQRSMRILICCKNNFPANKYIEDIHALSLLHNNRLDTAHPSGLKQLFRFFTPIRRVTSHFNDIARQYAIIKDDHGSVPDEKDLSFCRIIVTTVFTCPFLMRMNLPKEFFTHIIVDEAALISEPELNIPVSLAGHFTKIIIAGDEYQVTPKLSSPIAQRFGLELSLLGRLSNLPVYQNNSMILLKENYRSAPAIVNLLSKLYYDQSLIPMRAKQSIPHNELKPLAFHGVIGNESKIANFPSYMNTSEAEEIVHIVKELSKSFESKEIGVLSLYLGQVWLIRDYLRREKVYGVEVLTFEAIQGKEYRVLIINTVRTLSESEYKAADPHAVALLEDPKLLNTILGRAKDHIIVVGNPYTLCQIGNNKAAWKYYVSECINFGSFYLGDKQTFQFPVSADIHTTPVLLDSESLVNVEDSLESIKSRALKLIEQREESLKELQTLWEETVLIHPHLLEHFKKEKEIISTQKPLIELEKQLALELRGLHSNEAMDNSNTSNWLNCNPWQKRSGVLGGVLNQDTSSIFLTKQLGILSIINQSN
ncbi:hypothetical protein LOD99_11037 [Oopsacas minuta]|uniref:DNA2/NAM7 helicase-like C-terminal domain-containing protein n=1 Tax=Oopsacas minuta TaxID=111878 RepID=A0AAV7KB67_9METZ|nr:hypothetical protein LOD99_11037 [Oopsacas minuta]